MTASTTRTLDREAGLAAAVDIHATYLRAGRGPAMAKFIALVSVEGPLPADYGDRPAPDPAMFGLPAADGGSRDDPVLGQNMISCSFFQPDLDALRDAPTRATGVRAPKASGGASGSRCLRRRQATGVRARSRAISPAQQSMSGQSRKSPSGSASRAAGMRATSCSPRPIRFWSL